MKYYIINYSHLLIKITFFFWTGKTWSFPIWNFVCSLTCGVTSRYAALRLCRLSGIRSHPNYFRFRWTKIGRLWLSRETLVINIERYRYFQSKYWTVTVILSKSCVKPVIYRFKFGETGDNAEFQIWELGKVRK